MRKNTRSRHDLIIWMAQFAILLAIEALVCFTILGSIPMFESSQRFQWFLL